MCELLFFAMIIRRIIAAFFVFLFIAISLPTFLVYALSKTYFSPSFYTGPVVDGSYDFFVNAVSTHIYQADPTLQGHFKLVDVKKEVQNVFKIDILRKLTGDFGQEMASLKEKPDVPVAISLKVFQDSLLTVTHNLAYKLFQSLPVCKVDELPEVNSEGIPTCVPKGLDYANISAPISKQFEKTVYAFLPQQVQIDLSSAKSKNQAFYYMFLWIDRLKIYLLFALIALVFFVALIIYYPISLMLRFESVAFIVSGILGFLSSFLLQSGISVIFSSYKDGGSNIFQAFGNSDDFGRYLEYVFSFLTTEIRKISFIFLILGAFLFFIQFVLKRQKKY